MNTNETNKMLKDKKYIKTNQQGEQKPIIFHHDINITRTITVLITKMGVLVYRLTYD